MRKFYCSLAILAVIQGAVAFLLWRHWDLGEDLRAPMEDGKPVRYIARVGAMFTVFPLLLAFDYLMLRSFVTKEGFMARLIIALYGRNGN